MRLTLPIAVALVLAACAPPGAPPPGTTAAAAGVDQAQRRHEFPAASRAGAAASTSAGQAAGDPVRQPGPDPATAVRAFATAYINWTAATVTARLRTLASLSVGQARAAMTLAASETARDYELRRSGVANQGTVEAVAPLGTNARYVVVTRELTTATATQAYRGLRPAWHVTLATVAHLANGGWALSGWQPEN
jgi:hypothetical protein